MKHIGPKLKRAASELAYIQKDKKHGVGFNYLTSAGMFQRVNTALQNADLVVCGTAVDVISEGKVTTVKVTISVADPESGEVVSFQGAAQGQDIGDKALAKALTMAAKYLWMIAFVVSTGDESSERGRSLECLRNLEEKGFPEAETKEDVVNLFLRYEDDLKEAGDEKIVSDARVAMVARLKKFGLDSDQIKAFLVRMRESFNE